MLYTYEDADSGAKAPEPQPKPCQNQSFPPPIPVAVMPQPQQPQGAVSAPPKKPPLYFGMREWLGVVFALGLAILWFQVFGLDAITDGAFPPGIGVSVFVGAFFVAYIVLLGKRARFTISSIALLIAIGALAFIPAIFSDGWLIMANCFLLFGLCVIGFFLLSGFREQAWCRQAVVGKAIGFFAGSLFRHWVKPFRALAGLPFKGAIGLVGVVIGLLIALLLLMIILPLLMSADVVFKGYFSDVIAWLQGIEPFESLWKTLRVVLVFPLFFSLLYVAYQQEGSRFKAFFAPLNPEVNKADVAEGTKPLISSVASLAYATTLIVLDVVYAVFVVVQFTYLFGGSEVLAISGGYANYARSGFFELVAVAGINLAAVLGAVCFAKAHGATKVILRVCEVILIGATLVILVSAYWRMNLYIEVFGLSLLRALTLLGMAFIAICLVGVGVKVFKERFVFFRVFFIAGISLWIAFNYINIDARIAEYNVQGYLGGTIEQVDVEYLALLSPETLPALEKLAAEEPSYEADLAYWKEHYQQRKESLPWQKWSYSYAKYDFGDSG
ncbi:MAG: DUF4173 domain-containing protein [Coriobacteriaceae bacterium]|jgi:hypothetical protein|nr:DUF4173 domain-containing protein [Coriobacteriaceae bacterium]